MMKSLSTGENIENHLNVEEVLKYFAVNTFLINLDSYSGGMYHNYFLYEKDGICEILPWDLNMSFAGHNIRDAEKAINFPIDSPVIGTLENAPLIGKLLEIPEYKELHHGYLEDLVSEYIDNGKLEESIVRLDNLIGDYVKNDATAFYTYEEYKNSIPELITFGVDRGKSITEQLNGNQPSTEYGNITTDLNLSALGQMIPIMGNIENKDQQQMPNKENMYVNIPEDEMEQWKDIQGNMPKGEIPQGNAPIGRMQNMGKGMPNSESIFSYNNLIVIGTSLVVLGVAIIFVFKYKRKSY